MTRSAPASMRHAAAAPPKPRDGAAAAAAAELLSSAMDVVALAHAGFVLVAGTLALLAALPHLRFWQWADWFVAPNARAHASVLAVSLCFFAADCAATLARRVLQPPLAGAGAGAGTTHTRALALLGRLAHLSRHECALLVHRLLCISCLLGALSSGRDAAIALCLLLLLELSSPPRLLSLLMSRCRRRPLAIALGPRGERARALGGGSDSDSPRLFLAPPPSQPFGLGAAAGPRSRSPSPMPPSPPSATAPAPRSSSAAIESSFSSSACLSHSHSHSSSTSSSASSFSFTTAAAPSSCACSPPLEPSPPQPMRLLGRACGWLAALLQRPSDQTVDLVFHVHLALFLVLRMACVHYFAHVVLPYAQLHSTRLSALLLLCLSAAAVWDYASSTRKSISRCFLI